MSTDSDNPFRGLPAVHEILQLPRMLALQERHAHGTIVDAIRTELSRIRELVAKGQTLDGSHTIEQIAAAVEGRLNRESQPRLRSVINATGIVLHTNLGRAPIAEEAAQAAYEAARGYLNLEFDLDTGKRSSRQNADSRLGLPIDRRRVRHRRQQQRRRHRHRLARLVPGKEVIVSRGQLIEIGGSFRIPEIMAVSGAILREVGTTNITRLADYEKAITPQHRRAAAGSYEQLPHQWLHGIGRIATNSSPSARSTASK